MKKRCFHMMLCVLVLACLCVNAMATSATEQESPPQFMGRSARFSFSLEAGEGRSADSSFLLDANDSISISALYTPPSASVDFGLIDPDGMFHALSGSNGMFNDAIVVSQPGYYTFAVQNNSSFPVNVSGFVSP